MVVKVVQVWKKSKIMHEMLCFTIEIAVGGCKGRRCRTGGCGAVAAMFASCSGEPAMAGVFRGCGQDSDLRHVIGECNCRVLDALAGEFRGRGKASLVRHIIGECNRRFLDALGKFRGRGKDSKVWNTIEECKYRVLDALAGRGKDSKVWNIIGECNCRVLDALGQQCAAYYWGIQSQIP